MSQPRAKLDLLNRALEAEERADAAEAVVLDMQRRLRASLDSDPATAVQALAWISRTEIAENLVRRVLAPALNNSLLAMNLPEGWVAEAEGALRAAKLADQQAPIDKPADDQYWSKSRAAQNLQDALAAAQTPIKGQPVTRQVLRDQSGKPIGGWTNKSAVSGSVTPLAAGTLVRNAVNGTSYRATIAADGLRRLVPTEQEIALDRASLVALDGAALKDVQIAIEGMSMEALRTSISVGNLRLGRQFNNAVDNVNWSTERPVDTTQFDGHTDLAGDV